MIKIHVSNIDKSLMFYRLLFGRMPDNRTIDKMSFTFCDQTYEFQENVLAPVSPLQVINIGSKKALVELNKRMNLISHGHHPGRDCFVLDDRLGLVDPDGNKWIITTKEMTETPSDQVFDQCPIVSYN